MKLALLALFVLVGISGAESGPTAPSVLHFYQDYTLPVDLRNLRLVSDADISVALGGELVTFGRDSQLESNLAKKWTIDADGRYIDFELRSESKWSDGSELTSEDVVASFADGKANFGKVYPGLYEAYQNIETRGPRVVRFHLRKDVAPLTLLQLLVMSSASILKIENGKASMKVTSGPYSLKSADENELILRVNPHYFEYVPQMFSEIHIRRPKGSLISVDRLNSDPWPDIVYVPSVLAKTEMSGLPADTQVWQRRDRMLVMSILGRNHLSACRTLIGFVRANANLNRIAESGYEATRALQIHPKGVVLHSEKDPGVNAVDKTTLLKVWPKKTVEIAYDKSRIPREILDSIRENICGALPLKCEFVEISLRDLARFRKEGKYDFAITATNVDPVDSLTSTSYFFEASPSMIPSDKSAKGNFAKRIKDLRTSGKGLQEGFRALLFDAVEGGYVLPLFHTSTFVVGRSYIDFSLAETAVGNPDFQDMRRRP